MNVVVSVAITVNPGDAFPTHPNLLVCLDPRRDLKEKETCGFPWFPVAQMKTFHYMMTILLLEKDSHLRF